MKHPIFIEAGQSSAADVEKAQAANHPPPEEDLGGGDICSLEEQTPTEDDKPL